MKDPLRSQFDRLLQRIRTRVPAGLRFVVGLLLVCLGFLGFLPVLGFWMIPLGIAVMMLDIGPLWRRIRQR